MQSTFLPLKIVTASVCGRKIVFKLTVSGLPVLGGGLPVSGEGKTEVIDVGTGKRRRWLAKKIRHILVGKFNTTIEMAKTDHSRKPIDDNSNRLFAFSHRLFYFETLAQGAFNRRQHPVSR